MIGLHHLFYFQVPLSTELLTFPTSKNRCHHLQLFIMSQLKQIIKNQLVQQQQLLPESVKHNSEGQQTKAKPTRMTDTFDLIVTAKEMGIRSKNIDGLCIDDISLKNFQGETKQGYFLAHIYWAINYKFVPRSVPVSENYPMVVAQPSINPKSWMNRQCADWELIQHEYGHYLISCWCALDFMNTVNYEYKTLFKGSTVQEYKDWCSEVFKDRMKKYCTLERKYDEQTQHYCNQEEQKKWEVKIVLNINEHARKAKEMPKLILVKNENVRPISKQVRRETIRSIGQSNSKRISVSTNKKTAITIKEIAPPAYRIRPSNFPLRAIKLAQ